MSVSDNWHHYTMTMIMLSVAEGDVDSTLFDDIPPKLCKAGLQGALIRLVASGSEVTKKYIFYFL